MTYIAPAGTPIHARDITGGIGAAWRETAAESLSEMLVEVSGTDRCWPVCSARAGMTLVLRAMRAVSDGRRDRVIVPAYTCYSVPAAVARAGLGTVLCDVDPRTLSLDLDGLARLDFGRVLAVVATSLYGMPDDLAAIEALVRSRGAFLLDDAAQSLGARVSGRPVGGFGDAGLYSFDKGKPIATLQGGVIVGRDGPLARSIDSEWAALPSPKLLETLANLVKLAPYTLALDPRCYGVVRRLPWLGIGRTVYDTWYPMTRYSSLLAGVASRLLRRLDAINDDRRRNAARLRAALQGSKALRMIEPLPKSEPIYLRFPVRASSPALRDRLIAAFDRAGIGASPSYPRSLADVPEVVRTLASAPGDLPGARELASTIMTLPTHAFCPADFAERALEIARGVERAAA